MLDWVTADNHGWWFYDEAGLPVGPYADSATAAAELRKYINRINMTGLWQPLTAAADPSKH